MKIVIDSRFWGPGHTGLGVYTKELITNLAKTDNLNSYVLLVRPGFDRNVVPLNNFSFVEVDAAPYTFKEQILLALTLLLLNPDVAHFPSINVPILYFKKMVVTIHDLIKHQSRGGDTSTLPQPVYWFKYVVYLLLTRWLVHRSNRIIVPSQAVATDLRKKYQAANNKTVVTYEAPTINPSIKKVGVPLPEKFVIYTGNAYPHKNLPFLISTWGEVYKKTKTKLVLVCGRSVFAARIQDMVRANAAENWVEFKGYLTDEELSFAYTKASFYVFPTLMEGFGIPGLDAMSCSLPVLCSRLPVLEEIYGSAAMYFDPFDKSDLKTKATSLIESESQRKKLIAAGKNQVKKFSWEKLASQTLAVYKEAVL